MNIIMETSYNSRYLLRFYPNVALNLLLSLKSSLDLKNIQSRGDFTEKDVPIFRHSPFL